MCFGDSVIWHIMSVGNRINLHAVTFFGQAVSTSRNRIISVSLIGTEFKTVTMIPDNVGRYARLLFVFTLDWAFFPRDIDLNVGNPKPNLY